jgi:hypothetical protein
LLQQVQMEHTPVDVIVVDERHLPSIGRSYVTVAIDVVSRCVVGLVEAPSLPTVRGFKPLGSQSRHNASAAPSSSSERRSESVSVSDDRPTWPAARSAGGEPLASGVNQVS